jgi:endonuclease-3
MFDAQPLTPQVICLPVGPRCDVCLLGQQKLCPSRVAVNPANRKEINFNFADAGPKVEIAYEEEVKVKAEAELQEGETLVKLEETVEVKQEPPS